MGGPPMVQRQAPVVFRAKTLLSDAECIDTSRGRGTTANLGSRKAVHCFLEALGGYEGRADANIRPKICYLPIVRMIDPTETAVMMIVFNRPDQTRKVFERIREARPKRLYIAADGPRADRPDDLESTAE